MKRVAFCLAVLLICSQLACARRPSYFSLSPSPAAATFQGAGGGPITEVLPVRFPGYLDSLEMVTTSSSGEVSLDAKRLWASELRSEFQRVFLQDLSARLAPEGVVMNGEIPGDPDATVTVDVSRFDVDEGGKPLLSARWVVAKHGGAPVRSGVSVLEGQPVGPRPAERASALSALVDRLAEVIAAERSKL